MVISVLSVVSKTSLTSATCGARTVQPSGVHVLTPDFLWVRVARSLVFCVMFFRQLFVSFLLAIVLSVLLRFTVSDYPLWHLQTFLHPTDIFQCHPRFFVGSCCSSKILNKTFYKKMHFTESFISVPILALYSTREITSNLSSAKMATKRFASHTESRE